jgi:hypothetical protein
MSVVSVVCCQVEVSAAGRSLDQRSLTVCVACDLETLRVRLTACYKICAACTSKAYGGLTSKGSTGNAVENMGV